MGLNIFVCFFSFSVVNKWRLSKMKTSLRLLLPVFFGSLFGLLMIMYVTQWDFVTTMDWWLKGGLLQELSFFHQFLVGVFIAGTTYYIFDYLD